RGPVVVTRCAVTAQIDGYESEIFSERRLQVKKFAMRHQPVQQQQRAAATGIVIRDLRAIGRVEIWQIVPSPRRSSDGSCPIRKIT
ncbi:MAG: hypothetical protein M3Q15_01465, partial [Pseudomonadota bacterium]|nr:hypothetical protein [Pseudomonadota bacterium]